MLRSLFNTRRRKIAVVGCAIAVVAAVGAYAYLTASGSGSGSGSVTASAGSVDLSVSQSQALDKLGASSPVTVTATNNGTSAQKVTSVDTLTASGDAGCPAGSFTISGLSSTPQEIQPGDSAPVATATVTFNNVNSDQNACLSGVHYSAHSN